MYTVYVCIYIVLKLHKEVQKLDKSVDPHGDKIDLSFLLCPSGIHIICT